MITLILQTSSYSIFSTNLHVEKPAQALLKAPAGPSLHSPPRSLLPIYLILSLKPQMIQSMTPPLMRPNRILQIEVPAVSHPQPEQPSHLLCQPLRHRYAPMHARSAARQDGHMGHVFGHQVQLALQHPQCPMVGVLAGRGGEEGGRELGVETVPAVQEVFVGWDKFVAGNALQDWHT